MIKDKTILILSTITTATFLVTSIVPISSGFAQEFDLDAESVKLMEAETGRVLYEENSTETWAPASLTKIMTLVIGLEASEEGEIELDEKAVTSTEVYENIGGVGSTMFLNENQEVSIEDLLTGIAVVSANDGTEVLAEHLEGSVDSFVDRMNSKADELDLDNTNFENPHGLPDDNQYITAQDIAQLSKYAVNNTPKILELESITEFKFNVEDPQPNRNLMLPDRDTEYSYEGTDGLKTGQTDEAGYNFVGTAERNGMRMIAVVLGTEEQNERFNIAHELMDYGFDEYHNETLLEENEEVGDVEVIDGTERQVNAVASESLTITTAYTDIEELDWNFTPEQIKAPIEEGEAIGELEIYEDDEQIGTVTGVAKDQVDELGFFGRLFRTIGDGISGFFQNIRDTIMDFIFGD